MEKILNAGYALATAYRGDVDPDRKDGYKESIRSAWPSSLQEAITSQRLPRVLAR